MEEASTILLDRVHHSWSAWDTGTAAKGRRDGRSGSYGTVPEPWPSNLFDDAWNNHNPQVIHLACRVEDEWIGEGNGKTHTQPGDQHVHIGPIVPVISRNTRCA